METLTEDFIKKNIPLLGFGFMRLPTLSSLEEVNHNEVQKMVDRCMESGVNYFDTAYIYHGGNSEIAVKETIAKKYPREKYFVVDKLPAWEMETEADNSRIFNDQLKKCGVEYFDFYMLHALDEEKYEKHLKLGSFEFCKKMKEEGKIRFLGFSFHGTAKDLRRILTERPDMEFVQLQINYIDWFTGEEQEFYNIAREFNKPIIVMEPVRGGYLANLPNHVEKILKDYNKDASIASWAMRFCGSLDGVFNVLSGMSTMEHIDDNINSLYPFTPLSKEEWQVLEQAAKALSKIDTVPCTLCKYCDKCPQEIPIFDIFEMYNKYLDNKHFASFKAKYDKIDKQDNVSVCTLCGQCIRVCPQSIDIPTRLKEAEEIVG